MSAASHFGTYAEGWTKGDADTILRAACEGFTFDDPDAGQIPASEFACRRGAHAAKLDATLECSASRRQGRGSQPRTAA